MPERKARTRTSTRLLPAWADEEQSRTEMLLMFSEIWIRCARIMLLPVIAVTLTGVPVSAQAVLPATSNQDRPPASSLHWESPARIRRAGFISSDHGNLLIDKDGVEFRAGNAHSRHWAFGEIHTAFIAPHRLVLKTYINRSLHRPGQREYRFHLTQTLPPAVAARIAEAIARPSQNADPDPNTPAIAVVPVRHRGFASGTNGVLRFRQSGIDYVTTNRGDSRSWRWADLQTLSDSDPYHLFVFGYRDTYTFDLKEPLSRKLLDWAADRIFVHNESVEAPAIATSSRSENSASGDHHE